MKLNWYEAGNMKAPIAMFCLFICRSRAHLGHSELQAISLFRTFVDKPADPVNLNDTGDEHMSRKIMSLTTYMSPWRTEAAPKIDTNASWNVVKGKVEGSSVSPQARIE